MPSRKPTAPPTPRNPRPRRSRRRPRARCHRAQIEPARLARVYAQYRVLAATNRLVEALGVAMPTEAWSNERARYNANVIPPNDFNETSMPQPAMGPPASLAGE